MRCLGEYRVRRIITSARCKVTSVFGKVVLSYAETRALCGDELFVNIMVYRFAQVITLREYNSVNVK